MKFSTAFVLSTILASSSLVLARPTADEVPIQGVSALKTIREASSTAKTTSHKSKEELEQEKAKELRKKLGNGQKLQKIRTRRAEDPKTDDDKAKEILEKLGKAKGGLLSQKLKGTN